MPLQRINVGYGGLRLDGNLQVVTNTANVYLGNITYPVGSVFASNITSTSSSGNALTVSAAIVPSSNLATNLGTSTLYFGTVFAGQQTGNTLTLTNGTANAATITGNISIAGNLLPRQGNASFNIGSTTAWWNTFYGVSTQAKYADLAENYLADQPYAPGTVLEFGGDAEVTRSAPESARIAGVVSSNPAHLMNGALQGPNVVPVALLGRVPCQVVGPVAKGDMMVSAGFGYARASANPQPGQVIGKALATVEGQNKAVIEIVVGRL